MPLFCCQNGRILIKEVAVRMKKKTVIQARFSMANASVETEILKQGKRIDPLLDELLPCDGPSHLIEPIRYHLDTGGKRIRPALCLMTCDMLGGDSEQAIPFAAAVELLHNMLLLHDDIEDGDEMRRDKPSVWKAFGIPNAINAGDYLLGRALKAVTLSPVAESLRMDLIRVFIETYERTVEGQAIDINARSDPHFDADCYMRMAQLKTGHYLVLGMIGGASIAGAPAMTVQCLRRLGESMGPAFQIRDDMIDLTVGKGRGGVKGSDIREGKASILYAHALAHTMPEECERVLAIMAKLREDTTDDDVQWVISLYERCGSLDFAAKTADALIQQAVQAIEELPAEHQSALRPLIAYMVERAA